MKRVEKLLLKTDRDGKETTLQNSMESSFARGEYRKRRNLIIKWSRKVGNSKAAKTELTKRKDAR